MVGAVGGATIDPIFSMRCVDCDALGEPSRLWIRRSVDDGRRGRRVQATSHGLSRHGLSSHNLSSHYVECMNCGAHLKGLEDGRMVPVDDEEWRLIVDGGAAPGGRNLRPS